MDPRTLKRRLAAACLGLAIAALAVVGTHVLLPAQSVTEQGKDYGYVYSGAKSSSVDFLRATFDDDTIVMLGSSEFSTPAKTVPTVPVKTFGEHSYGLHASLVGEAFDQCLWHAIALGALTNGGELPGGKVVLICGLGQFTDGGMDDATFGERFSYSLYRGFCANDAVPEDVRSYVRSRLEAQGVDVTSLRSGMPENPLDQIDGAVLADMDDLRLRRDLMDVRDRGIERAMDTPSTPDWQALRADALETAQTMSTNNDWGAEDAFYEKLAPQLDGLAGSRADETYTDTPEYDDLECFLDVCDAMGVEPLVVVQPVMGPYYDHIGITRSTREAAYQHIRDIVASHEHARIADFSDREYEQYFLFDIVHFGWTGWIDAEKAIYEFAKGASDGTR